MNADERKLADTLEHFIDGLNLRYFKGREFTPYWDRTRNGIKNTVPPASLWPNIVPTLQVLNLLRTRLGTPLYLNSTYRSSAYNRAVGGVGDSMHSQFRAIDFSSDHVSPRRLHQYLMELRRNGIFKGGLGLYQTFVHIDTRGRNADWKGSGVA